MATTFRTYTAAWHWEARIYRLERIRLPMPVTFRWIGIAVATLFLVSVPLNQWTFVGDLPWAPIRWFAPPILLANWLTRAKLDGKAPVSWLITVAAYLVMHKSWAAYRPLKRGARERFRVRVLMRNNNHPAGG